MNILEADHISFSYPESVSPVLREITFSVSPGELIGLAGPSGSGKTTLLKHLNGLLRPTRGRILFHGEDTGRRGFRISALRRRVGLVFQYPEQQLFKKTVLEDVSFGPVNLGDSSEEAAAAAREALALMNLGGEYENRSPLELSGGEMRLAAIAGVLAMRPEVLVLDEPAAGLGGLAKTRLMPLIRTCPFCGAYRPRINLNSVLFPAPVLPINVTASPCCTEKLISCKTTVLSSYLNSTWHGRRGHWRHCRPAR